MSSLSEVLGVVADPDILRGPELRFYLLRHKLTLTFVSRRGVCAGCGQLEGYLFFTSKVKIRANRLSKRNRKSSFVSAFCLADAARVGFC